MSSILFGPDGIRDPASVIKAMQTSRNKFTFELIQNFRVNSDTHPMMIGEFYVQQFDGKICQTSFDRVTDRS